MAAHAIADGGVLGVAEVVTVGLVVVTLGSMWMAALRRAMVTADSSTQAGSVRRSRFDGLLPGGALGAVVAKELKYLRRDPRGRMGWLAAVGVSAVLIFSMRLEGTAMAVVPACGAGVLIGLQGANAFGIDGRALWMNAIVYSSPRDLRTDFAARHLAASLVASPLLAALSLTAALVAGHSLLALAALLVSAGILQIAFGVGAVTSVVLPYTYPERINAFSSAAPGQGGVAFAGSFGAMLVTGVLALPVTLPVLLGPVWLSAAALPYGLAVAYGGRRLAATIGYARLPDLLAAVSRPT
jgi:ABC-2 type transport system permease protein